MSERPSDAMQRPSKRRTEGQMTKDDYDHDDDDTPSVDPGTWKTADDETLKKRKIIKVRRHLPSAMDAAASQPAAAPAAANPFASISLTAPAPAAANPFANIMLMASQDAASKAPAVPATASDTKPEAVVVQASAAAAPSPATAVVTPAAAAQTGAPTGQSQTPVAAAASQAAVSGTPAAAEVVTPAAGPGDEKDLSAEQGVAAAAATAEDATTQEAAPTAVGAVVAAEDGKDTVQAAPTPAAGKVAVTAPPPTFTPRPASASIPSMPPLFSASTPAASSLTNASTAAQPGSGPPATPSLFSSFATSNASPFTSVTSGGKPFGGFGGNGFAGFNTTGATPDTGAKQGLSGFSFGSPNGGGLTVAAYQVTPSSVFGARPSGGDETGAAEEGASTGGGITPVVTLQPAEPTVTGEEDETTVFTCDGVLFEFDSVSQSWKERGRGELRVNIHQSGQARLVMRQKGNLRLLLNANLFPQIHVTTMIGGKGVTFSCVNAAVTEAAKSGEVTKDAGSAAGEEVDAEGRPSDVKTDKTNESKEEGQTLEKAAATASTKLGTYGIRIKQGDKLREFIHTVDTYKGKVDGAS